MPQKHPYPQWNFSNVSLTTLLSHSYIRASSWKGTWNSPRPISLSWGHHEVFPIKGGGSPNLSHVGILLGMKKGNGYQEGNNIHPRD